MFTKEGWRSVIKRGLYLQSNLRADQQNIRNTSSQPTNIPNNQLNTNQPIRSETVISKVAESSIVTICRVSQDRSFPPQTELRPGLKPMPSGCRRCTTRALEIAKIVPPLQLEHKREELMMKPRSSENVDSRCN